MFAKKYNNGKENPCISKSTVSRLLKDKKYTDYFVVDTDKKIITLQCNYKKSNTNRQNKFVVVSDRIVDLIIQQNSNLFAKYSLFLIYYCGHSQSGTTDFTAKQFLTACGYSASAGNYISQLSAFNRILEEKQIIKITKYRDSNGKERNIYKML